MKDKKTAEKKRGRRMLFYRRAVVCLMMLFQLVTFVFLFASLAKTPWVAVGMLVFTALVIVYILMRQRSRVAVLPWVVLCLAFPVFGGLLYTTLHFEPPSRRLLAEERVGHGSASGAALVAERAFPEQVRLMRYLEKAHRYPVYGNTEITYLPTGEGFFSALSEAIAEAKHFVYLEYFIIEDGVMWETLYRLLARKAAEGVKVRVMYDDVGCFLRLPVSFSETLKRAGIECAVFNPFHPWLNSLHNHRDHRKITVIDGAVAFTGGANIADEYINQKNVLGHWKDAAVRLRGEGAAAFAEIFMQNFSLCRKGEVAAPSPSPVSVFSEGEFVQPYADSPLDENPVSEEIYLSLIASAKERLYITTPYFIVSEEIVRALIRAAKSGTEVCVVTPHRGDSCLVHTVTRSYYGVLIAGGVKVYEYLPGFIHSKNLVADGRTCVVGTANFDYRSLRYHFECGAVLYSERIGASLLSDFESILKKSRRIRIEDCHRGLFSRIFEGFLHIFAPLM